MPGTILKESCSNCLSLISPPSFLGSFSFLFLFFSLGSWIPMFCFMHHCHSHRLLVSYFVCLLPRPERAQDEAESITLSANPPWATSLDQSCLSDFLPSQPSLQLSSSPMLPIIPHSYTEVQQAFRCALWTPFPRPNYYIFSWCGWSTGSNPTQFPIFQFLQKQLLKSSSQ